MVETTEGSITTVDKLESGVKEKIRYIFNVSTSSLQSFQLLQLFIHKFKKNQSNIFSSENAFPELLIFFLIIKKKTTRNLRNNFNNMCVD